ncbi:type IV secretory system conjugative DNA transfer family protein [Tomitella cavernea]|nr:TraM recognition domain-containing protein [Tomitella cavernea]
MSTPASRSEQQIMPIWFAPVATLLVGVVVAVVGGGVLAEVLSGVGVVWPPHGLVGVGQLLAGLVSSASDPGAAWAPHPSPGSPVIVWACIGVVGAVYTAAAISVAVWLSGRRMDRRHAREGFAGAAELRRRSLTEAKAREGGFAARVSLAGLPRHQRRQVPSSDLAVDVGHVVGAREHMWAQFRDGALVEGPTGSGKTWRIAWHRVIGAPGFCLATTTKPDLLWSTVAERAERGDVYVFDPENICAWPYRLRWSIIAGCDDPDTALRRAEALVQAMPIDDAKNGAYFTAKSIVLMRCYLYAAARLDASLRTLRTWASRRQVPEVREVLTRERPDWAAELEQTLGSSADSSEDIIGATSRLLEPLASPALMDALDVPVADSADLRSIIADGTNTLYLLSEGSSASAAPFVAALAAEVHHVAKQHALSLPGERLDPPAMLVLDELNNVAPIPRLPSLITDSGGRGLCIWGFVHSEAQNKDRWGQVGGRRLTTESPMRIVLPGLADDQELASLSRLIGDRDDFYSRQAGPRRVPILPAAEIRQMPADRALVIYRGAKPALVSLPTVWDTPALRERVTASRDYYESHYRQEPAHA